MAPTIAGLTTADVQTANSTSAVSSLAVNLPTSHASGQPLIIVATWRNSGAVLSVSTTGTAWTSKFNWGSGTNSVTYIFYVIDGGSEPSSVTINSTVSARCNIVALRITGGVTSGDPFDIVGTPSTTTAVGTTRTAPSVTTTQANTLLLDITTGSTGAIGGITPDAAMRELADLDSGATAGSALEIADESVAAAGATGTRAATLGTAFSSSAVLVAIAPAAGGATQNAAAAQTATATQAATGASTKPIDAAQTGTATQAAAATATKPVDAAQTVTATQAAAATVTPAGKSIDAAQSVTGTQAAAAATTKPVTASQSVVATQAATATVTTTQSATAAQALTATQAATASVVSAVSNRFYFVPPRRTRQVVADSRTGLLFEESYGMTVINVSGSYRLVEQPTQRELIDADAYYLGGHRTEITADEKTALETAGYSAGIETV